MVLTQLSQNTSDMLRQLFNRFPGECWNNAPRYTCVRSFALSPRPAEPARSAALLAAAERVIKLKCKNKKNTSE